jgi:hypothetical protein
MWHGVEAALRVDKLSNGHANIATDLPDQDRRNVTALMHWDGRAPAIGMTKLLVRTALPDLDEAEEFKARDDLSRF